MKPGLFITGTDTGVGKTVITRALVRAASRRGIDVVALKPVESGVLYEEKTDSERLVAAADRAGRNENITAYAFREPLSPHLAARLDGSSIEPASVTRFLLEWTTRADLVIAEGAGGFLVPVAEDVTFGDVVAKTGFSLLIVAPDVLGTVNATLLTIEAARRRNIDIAGVVLNKASDERLGNAETIFAYGRVPIIGSFPFSDTDDDDRLASFAESTLDLDRLFSLGGVF